MSELSVAVILRGDGKQLASEYRNVTAETDKFTGSMRNAAGDAARLDRALDAVPRSGRRVGQSLYDASGAAKTWQGAMRDLSPQLNDFSTQVMSGTSIIQAFIQQQNQAAMALSGLDGKVGAFARFMAGPWGAALTIATGVVANLTFAQRDAADATGKQEGASKSLKEALEDLAKASGTAKRSAEEEAKAKADAAQAALDDTIETRKQIAAKLDYYRTLQKLNLGPRSEAGAGAAAGAAGAGAGFYELMAERNAKEIADAQDRLKYNRGYFQATQAAAAATDAAAAATQRYDRAVAAARQTFEKSNKTEADQAALTKALTDAKRQQQAAIKAAQDATRDAAREQREANKEQREAEKAAKELASSFDGLEGRYDTGTAALKKYREELALLTKGVGNGRFGAEQADVIEQNARQAMLDAVGATKTGPAVATQGQIPGSEIKFDWEKAGVDFGYTAAKTFNRDALEGARAIGDLIGGKIGQRVGGLLGVLNGNVSTSGQFEAAIGKTLKPFSKSLDKLGTSLGTDNLSGQIAKGAGKALAGAAEGMAASGVAAALGLKQSKTGAAVGGALGQAFGPAGSIVGGLIGGTLGGALKKVKSGSATLSLGDAGLGVGSVTGNSDAFKKAASGALGGVVANLNQIAELFGGSVTGSPSVSIGVRHGDYRVDTTGSGITKKKKGAVDFNDDQAGAIAFATLDALKDGVISGFSAAVAKALKSSDDLEAAIREATKVQEIEDLLDPSGAVGRLIKTEDRLAKERVRIATKYGFDVAKIEQINADKRKAVMNQILEAQTGSLRQFLNDLAFGDLAEGSSADKLAALDVELNKAKADAEAGKEGANDRVAQLLRQRLDLSRALNGTAGGQYSGDLSGAKSTVNALIDQASKRVQDAAAEKLDTTNSLLDENANQNAKMVAALDQNNQYLSQIAAYFQGIGGINAAAIAAMAR